MRRYSLALLLLGAISSGYTSCSPPPLQLVAPVNLVTTASFAVQVQVASGLSFDPATGFELNGVAIPLAGGPNTYTATVNPGPPLLDRNVAKVTAFDGTNPLYVEHNFRYAPPSKARVVQITSPSQLLTGPLAHGRVGDWLIENGDVRFVIQDVAQRDLYSVGAFGGNVIDAELVARPGTDNFIEMQPMLDVESVINAQTLQVVNDGQNGLPAVLRVCGPDDLLDFVNPSTFIVDAGFASPPFDDRDLPIEACTDHILAPGAKYLQMDTTVFNNGPTDLQIAPGDWMNPGGELDHWDKPLPLGESAGTGIESLSYVGVGEANGVDYGWVRGPNPGTGSALANIFTTSGVSVILINANALNTLLGVAPPFPVAAGGQRSYTRYLAVGDGTASNTVALETALRAQTTGTLSGCVTVGGAPLANARVSVVTRNPTTGAITRVEDNFVSRSGPCPNYTGTIRTGNYDVAAVRKGSPFEGGATTPPFHPISILASATTSAPTIDLAAPGAILVTATDELGAPVPARVSVVGIDPSPLQTRVVSGLGGFFSATLEPFQDPGDRLPYGLVAIEYTGAGGLTTLEVEPGTYEVYVSRGTEWSVHHESVTVGSGGNASVNAQIARVLDTSGFVSSDFHVHGIRSADSRINDNDRVRQFAGEGVDNIIMTDHHVHTNLTPTIAALGLSSWIGSTIGEEITTFDYGHFNGYPFTVDPTKPSGGSTDWAKAAPPGQDFPSLGAFNGTPAEIFALATAGAQSTPDTAIQVNHIDSHFGPMQIDTSVAGPISDGLDDAERLNRRLPPFATAGNLFQHFPALELWNGANRNAQSQFLNERIGIWMNHLNKGLRTTAISDTDTHTFTDLESAGARTWTAAVDDSIAGIDGGEVARAVWAGRAVGGQGLYVQTRLLAQDGSGGVASLVAGGSTEVVSGNGSVDLEVKVQAPTWARFDRIEVYSNAPTTPTAANPYLFGATPAVVLTEGDCNPATTGDGDFDISVVNVHPVAAADRQEVTVTVSFPSLTQDAWFAVVVKGTDGICAPMFPIYPRDIPAASNATLANLLDGNVGEGGVMALGVANALYADVDGTPGIAPSNP